MVSLLSLLPLVPYFLVAAATDSAPCISGTCTYQSGDGLASAWSVLAINTEKATSLSDITAAAGWDIVECDPYSIGPQDIRLVCTDRSKGCDQLFEGGEENTIVRLPDSCAGGPFARVVKSWIPDDQTVPARLAKRQLDAPVLALTLDFDFSQIPVSNGKVYFTATATTSQTQRDALTLAAAKRSLEPLRHATRSGQDSATIRDFVEASKKDTVSPRQVQNPTDDKTNDTTASTDGLSFNTPPLHLIDIDQKFPVFTAALTCPSGDAGIFIDATVKAKINAEVGVIVKGTIIPPRITRLAFTSKLYGGVATAFNVKAAATGKFDTKPVPLYQTGMPGLNFAGILSVGPSFSLNAQVKADIGVTADIQLATKFDIPEVNLIFPPNQGQSSAKVVSGPIQIKANVENSEHMKGHVEAHILPTLEVGISILGGLGKTSVFLNVNGVAEVDFDLSKAPPKNTISGTRAVTLGDAKRDLDGTVGADVGVSINAGTTKALQPFFQASDSVPLFSNTFFSFQDTLGKPPAKRSLEERAPNFPGLSCPVPGKSDIKQPIIDVDAPAPAQ